MLGELERLGLVIGAESAAIEAVRLLGQFLMLSTFSTELGQVTLIPGTGGIFEIHLDGELIWERKRDGGFPDIRLLKQMVRDRIDPDRDLGHVDRVNLEQ